MGEGEGQAAWLGLGSNLGDRAALIGEALRRLAATPGIALRRVSGVYRTPPWGDLDQGEFLNAAAAISTILDPHALLDACQAIEREVGRVPGRRWGPRAIDIDILHCDGVTLADARLTLPHPWWRERPFVLVPLAEIAPDLAIEGVRVVDALAGIDRSGVTAAEAIGSPDTPSCDCLPAGSALLPVMSQTIPWNASKFALYRARKRSQGKKLLRIWVMDPTLPGFQDEVARQVALLREAAEEIEALDFMKAVWAEDGWPE